MTVGVAEKDVWMVVLDDAAEAHDKHPIRLHNGVEAVSDGKDCARSEVLLDRLLDVVVSPVNKFKRKYANARNYLVELANHTDSGFVWLFLPSANRI